MKLKNLFLVFLALALPASIHAGQVTQSQAKQIALNYMGQKGPKRIQGVNPATPNLQLAYVAREAQDEADYYVFNNSHNNGFIIVAGDDRAVPVLGYTDSGTFDPNNIPDGLQCLLLSYKQEMNYLRNNPRAAKAQAPEAHNPVVKPLLTCNWNQRAPFNNLCPIKESVAPDYHCPTGCVATGAAQIMYYHKWPKQGQGSNTYVCDSLNGREITADFNHTYDWDNMIDNYIEGQYSDQQANAVAALMFDAGVAANMNYGKSSSASCYWMMDALRSNFGYNKGMRYELRSTKTITEWEQLIFNELNNKRPILYSGFTPKGGHTFVLDGYNADGYFHFNWGWGSLSNGYFVITILNPREQGVGSFDGGYNTTQSMVTGLYPQQDGVEPEPYLEISCEDFMPTVDSVELGENVKVELLGFVGTGFGYGRRVDIDYVFVLTDANNEIIETYDEYPLSMRLGTRYTYSLQRKNCRNITPSTVLEPGEYHLTLMYKRAEEESSKYTFYKHSSANPGYVLAQVKNGKIFFSKPKVGNSNLKVDGFDYPKPVGDNSYFPATLKLSNSGDEYYGDIHIAAKGGDLEDYQELYSAVVDVAKDAELTLNFTMFPPRGAADYQMVVRDNAGNVIYGPCTLTVAPSDNYVLEAASQLTPGNYYMKPDDVNAHIDIKNTGTGNFLGCISYEIQLNGARRAHGVSDVITIAAGETKTVNLKTHFEGQPTVEYNFRLFNIKADTDEEKERIRAAFMLADEQTAIADISTAKVNLSMSGNVLNVTGAAHVSIYNVMGALVASGNNVELPAGVYVVVADDTVHKIAVK